MNPKNAASGDINVAEYLEQSRRARRWARLGWAGLVLCAASWSAYYLEYLGRWSQLILLLSGALGLAAFLLYLCTTPFAKSRLWEQ